MMKLLHQWVVDSDAAFFPLSPILSFHLNQTVSSNLLLNY